MTDLQRLIEWNDDKAKYHELRSNPEAKYHAETARILALLLRVREKCDVDNTESWAGPNFFVLSGPADTLRDLAELLRGGS